MKILVTICARGGSKGVKNKNIRELAGKPLIFYTIDAAKKWGKATRIVCSTDSPQIAEVAKECGAEVPFMRPPELATDEAGKVSVIRHTLVECQKIYGEKYDLVVDLDVTSPIRTSEDLEGCLKLYEKVHPDVVFSVLNAQRNPYFNMVEIDKDGFAVLCKDAGEVLRRQDAPKVYDMNASIYFYNPKFLLSSEDVSIYSAKKKMAYVMEDDSAIDIDSELDFKIIEFLLKEKVVSL